MPQLNLIASPMDAEARAVNALLGGHSVEGDLRPFHFETEAGNPRLNVRPNLTRNCARGGLFPAGFSGGLHCKLSKLSRLVHQGEQTWQVVL